MSGLRGYGERKSEIRKLPQRDAMSRGRTALIVGLSETVQPRALLCSA